MLILLDKNFLCQKTSAILQTLPSFIFANYKSCPKFFFFISRVEETKKTHFFHLQLAANTSDAESITGWRTETCAPRFASTADQRTETCAARPASTADWRTETCAPRSASTADQRTETCAPRPASTADQCTETCPPRPASTADQRTETCAPRSASTADQRTETCAPRPASTADLLPLPPQYGPYWRTETCAPRPASYADQPTETCPPRPLSPKELRAKQAYERRQGVHTFGRESVAMLCSNCDHYVFTRVEESQSQFWPWFLVFFPWSLPCFCCCSFYFLKKHKCPKCKYKLGERWLVG
jgi:hypothetical protein